MISLACCNILIFSNSLYFKNVISIQHRNPYKLSLKCPSLRNISWHDILVTHSINILVQQLVHGPYSDITMISLTRSPHAYFMIFLNSLSPRYINTFLATSIQTQHPSLPSSEYIKPIGRQHMSP